MPIWSSLWFTNIHFAIQLFGSISFAIMVYVLLISWKGGKETKIIIRAVGFTLLAIYFALNSAGEVSDLNTPLLLQSIKFLGLLITAVSFFKDRLQLIPGQSGNNQQTPNTQEGTNKLPDKPKTVSQTKPSFALITGPILTTISTVLSIANLVLFIAITVRVFIKHTKGLESELKNCFRAFAILLLAEFLTIFGLFGKTDNIILSTLTSNFGPLWLVSHVLEFTAFVFLAIYAWGYLRFRIGSQVIGAFITASLFIFVLTTFAFTSLLVRVMQQNSIENLEKNLRTLEYAINRLQDQSLATAKVVASNQSIKDAISNQDYQTLTSLLENQIVSSNLDFLVAVNTSGFVLARGEETETSNEQLSQNPTVSFTLEENQGRTNISTREWVNAPQVLIESATPIEGLGAIYAGYIIDNAFADGLKEATGLEVTVFGGNVRSATTLVGVDNESRLIGTLETNNTIKQAVLEQGQTYSGLSRAFHKEYISAYGPLTNYKDETLGMMFVGYPSIVLFNAAHSSMNITFYITMVIAILSFIPAYLLAKFIEKHQV
jgi:hypothetical protein